MSDEQPAPRRRTFVDLTPLKVSPAFMRLWLGGSISGIGTMMTTVAVGLQVYDLTESTFAVSLVGGIALLPMVIAGLWGGMLIDAFDRRAVLIVSALVSWATVAGLALMAWYDTSLGSSAPVWPLYLLATINSVAGTIQNAARFATIPRLVSAPLVPAATALTGIGFGFQLTVGPALAGVLVASVGFAWTYLADVILFTFGFIGIVTLPRVRPEGTVARPGWESLKAGMRFLRHAPNLRASFLVDIIAMTFGRPHVLFPALGALVVGGGPITVGILVAAGAVGTFFAGLFSGPVGHVRHHGIAIANSIIVYAGFVGLLGGVVLVLQVGGFAHPVEDFAGVNWFGLIGCTIAQMGMGASDEISRIFRHTMLMLAVPDQMRGRLQGIFTVVVTGGPRVGDLYVGLFSVVALWFPPVLGAVLIVLLILLVLRVVRSFREYDADAPTP